MKNQEFYKFVNEIAGDDKVLAESIIVAHEAIYSGEAITEGKLAMLAKAGLLAGSLATSALADSGEKNSPSDIQDEAKEAVTEIQEEYMDEFDMSVNDAFEQAVGRYNDLLESDPDSANLFARIINSVLHRKLSIAPPIGKQVAD